eukprot:TRINITY_DN91876_c0_g1_i1.p1 TRINITY_DN91876_c0_g1~~TRINITY_DN91876_c0_g1_i1.p1  ORF type:complete len:417 (+),score=106.96 TRINITY_DN91876_c0_g1_i1:138-1388(+)
MDGGASFDVAPPMPDLGNYKGVMLCNRPSEAPKAGAAGGGDAGPFRSMVAPTYGDQVGLTPARNFEPTVKKRGPSAALRRHVRWLRELQEQMREERDQGTQEEQDEEERRQRFKAITDKHREAVRDMMNARDDQQREDAKIERAAKLAMRGVETAAAAAPPGSTAPAYAIAQESQAPAAPAKKGAGSKAAKPLWAMTEKEREDFEEEEADDLINFAENLDYDKFVGDMEFRSALHALKDRTGRLKKEQDAFKDDLLANFNTADDDEYEESTVAGSSKLEDGLDGQSLLGSEYSVSSSRRARERRERQEHRDADWDNSTNAGDDKFAKVDPDLQEIAEIVMENAPHMNKIHSKQSVTKLIEKARAKGGSMPDDLVDLMRQEGGCVVPVITTSADTQNRLHKPVDPSQLPYLYRSPAV